MAKILSKNSVLSIDPSGTGITGLFLTNGTKQSFQQFQDKDWKEHLKFLVNYVKDQQVNQIIYEHTNYINLKGKDMTSKNNNYNVNKLSISNVLKKINKNKADIVHFYY